MKTNRNFSAQPLSRTAVQNLDKWGPPLSIPKQSILDGLILPFRRHDLRPELPKKLTHSLFSSASFSVFQDLDNRLSPFYIIQWKKHNVISPTYKYLKDYLNDYFLETISEKKYHVPYGSYLWDAPAD